MEAVCSCGIKTEIPLINDIKKDKDSLLNSFTDINNIANIKLMQCYRIVFQKKYIIKNIGFYIFACLIVLNFACIIYFIIKDYKIFIKDIYRITLHFLINARKKINNLETKNNYRNKQLRMRVNEANKDSAINNKDFKINGRYLTMVKAQDYILPPIFDENFTKRNLIIKDNLNNKGKHNSSINKGYNPFLIKIRNKILRQLNYNEINSLPFKDAINLDKRNFIQYYLSLLKTKHSILYIFYTKDYNSKIIKVSIQIFDIATLIAVNALFFNDETMHKIYVDKGSFDFIYQLPQIIYSTIISFILNMLIQFLGLTEDNILIFKNGKFPLRNFNQKFNKLKTLLQIKFAFFFIISTPILFSYWYYVTCFCGIYRNTQIHLLKDSLFSFITSLITPFCIYLIPSAFRLLALKLKSKILYGFSKLLQMI